MDANETEALHHRFVEHLGEFLRKQGDDVTMEPTIGDGKKPDMFVRGRGGEECYIEAIVAFDHKDLNEAKIINRLIQHQSNGGGITLKPLGGRIGYSPSNKEIDTIKKWFADLSLGQVEAEISKVFTFGKASYKVTARVAQEPGPLLLRVSWSKHGTYEGPSNQWQGRIREKTKKYKPTPESLGDTPLVIAVLNQGSGAFGETETYGMRQLHIGRNGKSLGMSFTGETIWRTKNGMTRNSRRHLLAVWVWHPGVGDVRPTLYCCPMTPEPALPKSLFGFRYYLAVEEGQKLVAEIGDGGDEYTPLICITC